MSYADILSDDLQNELLNLQSQTDYCAWRIGDIANEVITTGQKKTQVYKAIAVYSGRASRTVREYAMVSAFYPPETRERYSILAFDHFRIAQRFEDWEAVLTWAVEQGDEIGRPATVDAVIRQFAVQAEADDMAELHSILLRLYSVVERSKLSADVLGKVRELIDCLESETATHHRRF